MAAWFVVQGKLALCKMFFSHRFFKIFPAPAAKFCTPSFFFVKPWVSSPKCTRPVAKWGVARPLTLLSEYTAAGTLMEALAANQPLPPKQVNLPGPPQRLSCSVHMHPKQDLQLI